MVKILCIANQKITLVKLPNFLLKNDLLGKTW